MAGKPEAIDVVVVGSCNVDLISYVPVFPRAGETLSGHHFQTGCGGKGANACVMAAKLGAKTAMVGRLGDDSFGEMYCRNFSKYSINIDFLKSTKGVATGVAPIFVNDQGENAIVIVKGANEMIDENDLKEADSMIQNSKVVLCQLEIDPDITLQTLKAARRHGVTTIFNPAPAIQGLSQKFLKYSDIVVCNETEAEILTGMKVNSESECENALLKLLDSGCSKVIITLGSKGAICAESEARKPIMVKSKQVKAVDTTGAGDAFVGSVAFFLATRGDQMPLQEIVEKACQIAAFSVTRKGTQTSYPDRSQLPSHIFE